MGRGDGPVLQCGQQIVVLEVGIVGQDLGAPLTEQAKRKILGENMLRLHGMPLPAKV